MPTSFREKSRTALIRPPAGLALAATAWFWCASDAGAVTRYVNANLASGANNGTSWADAYQGPGGLATAIAAAVNGDQVWVVAAAYKPTLTATRTISFNLKTGVQIYGGFIGSETALDQRDFNANITTLTGDLLGNDGPIGTFTNNAENSHHVVNGAGANATAILDGFTISGGNANGAGAQDFDKGGGMIFLNASNGTIRNCRVIGNRCTFGGGAGYIRQASPNFSDCTFQTNQGGSFGGAFDMANFCNPVFNRCSFIGNTAARAGGVEVFGSSQPTISNCVFRGNSATGASGGGGLWVGSTSTATLRNCTIAGNSAGVGSGGGGILTTGSTTNVFNCIVWSNTGPGGATAGQQLTGATYNAQYSDVQNGFAGAGNINANPLFVNLAGGDVHIGPGSPCIDAANNALAGAGITIDRDGNPRFVDDPATTDTGLGTPPIIDMGAYEFQPRPDVPCPADVAGDDGQVNVDDLLAVINAWGNCPRPCPPHCPADINDDCTINVDDLLAVINAWGPCE